MFLPREAGQAGCVPLFEARLRGRLVSKWERMWVAMKRKLTCAADDERIRT